ncbi:PREDICTED: ADAM DEC1 isoform X2 [Galeopterus variegatus]|uniref:ADAM DEC1 isoform X2 n=1 Tax=Galeopterus variegatus TaxID=482537 RepID=A0ABM0RX85_GALVR|nr:PREDICTED: ADAM DEC1 isoform X2 [Galeopterus variegatus]
MLHGTSQLPAIASMFWVLLSVLWLIVQTQAIKETPELKLHEVVCPKKLHILRKREIENNQTEKYGKEEKYESEVQYQITLNGEEVILHLQKTKHLLGPDYSETYYLPGGEEITRNLQNMEHCYYEGHILNEKNSVATISTCDGLRGYFTHHDQRYLIKPLKNTDQKDHAVFIHNQQELGPTNHTCGVRNVGRKQGLVRTSRSLQSPEQEDFLQAQKYIDLFLVLDNAFYKIYKENQTLIRSFVFDVINLLNVIYKTIDVRVALVGMEIWSDGDKIKVEPNTGTTFNNFLSWHRSKLWKKKVHDHAQLLSGVGFSNGNAGLAALNSLCTPSSVAVIEAKKKNKVALVGVMSHELGHALGMADVPYDTKCPSGSCVMNQYLSSKFPKDFSTSCRSRFQRYLSSYKPKCLLRAPTPENIITKPVCGNQLREVGEDCDCGSPKECTNLCCEAMTCKLKPGPDCEENTLNQIIK